MNVAEGHKQRVILESEGHLEAKSNEADAKYKTIFREAEARYALNAASPLIGSLYNTAYPFQGNNRLFWKLPH